MNVLCSGNIAMDYYGDIKPQQLFHHLNKAETIKNEISKGTLVLAGKGLNQARSFERSGITTWLHGSVGTDALGLQALETAKQQGLETRFVALSPKQTLLLSINKERDALPVRVEEDHASAEIPVKEIHKEFILNCTCVVAHARPDHKNILELFSTAKDAGVRTVFNPAPIGDLKGLEPVMEADLIIANKIEAETLLSMSGQKKARDDAPLLLARWLYSVFGKTSIVTLGNRGVVSFDGKESWYNQARSMRVVDTVGSGDAFLGFCVSALLFRHPLPKSLQIGQAAASWVCERRGACLSGLSFAGALHRLPNTPAPQVGP